MLLHSCVVKLLNVPKYFAWRKIVLLAQVEHGASRHRVCILNCLNIYIRQIEHPPINQITLPNSSLPTKVVSSLMQEYANMDEKCAPIGTDHVCCYGSLGYNTVQRPPLKI